MGRRSSSDNLDISWQIIGCESVDNGGWPRLEPLAVQRVRSSEDYIRESKSTKAKKSLKIRKQRVKSRRKID